MTFTDCAETLRVTTAALSVVKEAANMTAVSGRGKDTWDGKIAEDAKETVQECVSEFISFITSKYGGKIFYMLNMDTY
ncbi:nuclear factor YB2 [Tanacetum coccineum]